MPGPSRPVSRPVDPHRFVVWVHGWSVANSREWIELVRERLPKGDPTQFRLLYSLKQLMGTEGVRLVVLDSEISLDRDGREFLAIIKARVKYSGTDQIKGTKRP